MEDPIPYCCLNCAGTQNCCGVCGECPEYCEKCEGIISRCSSYAYLGSDYKFYKKYTATATAQGLSIYHQEDIDCAYRALITNNSTASLMANSEGEYNIQGQKSFLSNDSCVQENACSNPYRPYTSIITTKNKKGEWIDYRKENCKNEAECTCDESIMFYSESGGSPPPIYLVDGVYEACNLCMDFEEIVDYQGQNLMNRDYFCGKGKVTFSEELKLYDSSGEEVLNPLSILGNPGYNICSPIQILNAPSCHFFHP